MKNSRILILAGWIVFAWLANRTGHYLVQPRGSDVVLRRDVERSRNQIFNVYEQANAQTTLEVAWKELVTRVDEISPGEFEVLDVPATTSQLEELETSLGIRLPGDFRAWLQIHNGAHKKNGDEEFRREFCGFKLLNTEEILAAHRQHAKVIAEDFNWDWGYSFDYLNGFWSPAIIEIAHAGDLNLCIDVESGKMYCGELGHPGDPYADSFTAFVKRLTRLLGDDKNFETFPDRFDRKTIHLFDYGIEW